MRRIAMIAITAAIAGLALASGGHGAHAGGGCHSDVLSDEANTQVELTKNCFAPIVARVQPGDTVTFTNGDPDAHTVTGVANSWGTYDELGQSDTVSYQFDEAGVFPYFCVLHPSMAGAVVVGDSVPAAASRTAADDGVKAVSAQVSGGEADEAEAQAITEAGDGSGMTVPLVIGVGVLAAGAGFGGALVLRRRSVSSEGD
jgi:plastocyanin